MVNSISKITQNLIYNDLSILDALQRGYANYSAVARLLKTKVEKILGSEIKLESLITSVKRSKVGYSVLHGDITTIIAGSVINLRTDMAKISIDKTKYTLKTVRKALLELTEEFFQIIEGSEAITIIFDQNHFKYIYNILRKEEILDEKQNLASININSPKEIIETPGCALAFYNAISRRGLNIEETISCFTDTIIILPMKEVGEALIALTNLISEARS